MAEETKKKIEVSLNKIEADVVIAALSEYQKDTAKVGNAAQGLGIKKAFVAVQEFGKFMDDLKAKFL